MSSGQQAWRDEEEALAWEERKARLQALEPADLAEIADEIRDALIELNAAAVALPRAGWRALDKINEEVRKLR